MEKEKSSENPTIALLDAWAWRAKRATFANNNFAKKLEKRHYFLGGALVIFSVLSTSLAGRSFLGVSSADLDGPMTVFSAITLTLACMHVFLGDASRAEKYRKIAAQYGAIKREIEDLGAKILSGKGVAETTVSEIRNKLDVLAADAPPIPETIWAPTNSSVKTGERSFRLIHFRSVSEQSKTAAD